MYEPKIPGIVQVQDNQCMDNVTRATATCSDDLTGCYCKCNAKYWQSPAGTLLESNGNEKFDICGN